jgi:polysaccharide deacetylase family protein (PEP-CTERM system associated)
MNALTFDVEDYYQVSAFESIVRFEDWGQYESRVERNTLRLLELLEAAGVHATFFVLGWVAERHTSLVQAIHRAGHELASHGYRHQSVCAMTPEQFREDVRRAKGVLENITGWPVIGFRAPSFTITASTLWALPILIEEGFCYDSSIFPIRHDRYGIPQAPPHCHLRSTPSGSIWEIPPSTVQFGSLRAPIAGGGYFRLVPYRLLRSLLKSVQDEGQPLVMYFHPWEIDPSQPRLKAPWMSVFRHYTNLHKTERRLVRLLTDFRFAPIQEAIAPIRQLTHELVA